MRVLKVAGLDLGVVLQLQLNSESARARTAVPVHPKRKITRSDVMLLVLQLRVIDIVIML